MSRGDRLGNGRQQDRRWEWTTITLLQQRKHLLSCCETKARFAECVVCPLPFVITASGYSGTVTSGGSNGFLGMLNHHCGSSNPARKIGSRIMKQSSWAWNGGDATQDVDACMDRWNDLVSDHGYQYSIGIGDAYKLTVPLQDKRNLNAPYWHGGTAYNYGIGEANYPVPAILTHTVIEADYVFQSWQVAISEDGITALYTGVMLADKDV